MPEDAIHYYLNLTESDIDPTVVALSVIILSQSITVTTMSYEKVMLLRFCFKQNGYTVW